VVPHCPPSHRRAGGEDQPKPLPEPGSGYRVAGAI